MARVVNASRQEDTDVSEPAIDRLRNLLIVAGAVILILGGVVVYLVFRPPSPPPPESSGPTPVSTATTESTSTGAPAPTPQRNRTHRACSRESVERGAIVTGDVAVYRNGSEIASRDNEANTGMMVIVESDNVEVDPPECASVNFGQTADALEAEMKRTGCEDKDGDGRGDGCDRVIRVSA